MKLEFNGLKTHTTLNFRNKREEVQYWSNLLLDSVIRYKNEFSKYLNEKLHVLFTWMLIFRYTSYGILIFFIISLFNQNRLLMLINLSLGLLTALISFVYYFKFGLFASKVMITETLNTPEFLEELREIIIKDRKAAEKLMKSEKK